MRGDFSRRTFDQKKHYHSVLMQQGRVQLDADWNEQSDLLNYHFETHLKDLLGASGAPLASAGFKITHSKAPEEAQNTSDSANTFDFSISHGRYYVDGILCENEQGVLFTKQPDYPEATLPENLKDYMLVYLDVWQRHITVLEDPSLRESALSGIDTTTRVQTVWQAKLLPLHTHKILADHHKLTAEDIISLPEWHALLNLYQHKGHLKAQRTPHSSTLDNQLYRVEIHHVQEKDVTFKWSRENGSVAFAIDKLALVGNKDENDQIQFVVTLSDLVGDATQLQKGDWIELVDAVSELKEQTLPLYQLQAIPDIHTRQVTLTGQFSPRLKTFATQKPAYLLLRRWDHNPALPPGQTSGTLRLRKEHWLNLEKGIQVYFTAGGTYEVGDYWLLPARTLTDTIEWPSDAQGPLALPPYGKNHHVSPLTLLHLHKNHWKVAKDLRRIFAPLPVISERSKNLTLTEQYRSNHLFEECISSDDLDIGDLVVLASHHDLHVSKATSDNARLLFGVVSEVSERNEENSVRVTIYGRARCNVIGPVVAGDLLTVSERDGCATAAQLADELVGQGSIIGKALTAYDAEDPDRPGSIDVLVTLQ